MITKVEQIDRDRALRILNFAFRNTDVEISGECFDDMASEIAAHREATAKAAEQAVLAKLREPSFDMVRKLNAACDAPDVNLAWVFPYIATLLQEQKP